MIVLGIETSCDDTGVAIYDAARGLLSDHLYSQVEIHVPHGGVVPELASRDHIQKIMPLTQYTLRDANLDIQSIQAIAYTAGPGLAGSLMVGATFAKSLGWALNVPTLGLHHMEAHLLAAMLEPIAPSFPFLALLVSGGHTLLIDVTQLGCYRCLGETLDDAVGEAFDKTAKMLGLPYPGGVALENLATLGQPRFSFPKPMITKPGFDFSYSGLKTHVVNLLKQHSHDEQLFADIAYAFQQAAVATLVARTKKALHETGRKTLVVAGGVGANKVLRFEMNSMADELGASVYYPRPRFCTDNGAMVAYLGCQRLLQGQADSSLSISVRPRWSLEQVV